MVDDLRLLLLGDLHGNRLVIRRICRESSEEITAFILCGDITDFGSYIQAEETLKEITESSIPVLFVPGNCDPKELVNTQAVQNAVNIHGRCREIEDICFLGIGGSPFTPFHTPFEMSEEEMKKILNDAYKCLKTKKRFILISHTPPIGTKVDLTYSGVHAGSRAVREFVEAKKPSLVLCGHIHEARGTDVINGTIIVNPGPANRGLWATIDVEEEIRAKLQTL